ncbi:50S ribosomal protein L21 [candidate division KSB1 bacterium]|nr:50S ribosomal protein L21 [candidate division KSB1 bacterium]
MYAIVEIAGTQFKVEKDRKILAPKLDGKAGDELTLDKVLLVADEGNVKIGHPVVEGASVKATILGATRGEKVIVFKKKRRKAYRVKNGHRQDYTELQINEIV